MPHPSDAFCIGMSLEANDNTESDGSFVPGFELQLAIFAIIVALDSFPMI